jgi:cell division protein ZapE
MPDQAQAEAAALLDDLYRRVMVSANQKRGLFRWRRRKEPEVGLYFWGGVGRGKTHLLDLFSDALPQELVLRVHFHRFMYRVHNDLRTLQGEKNPLLAVADGIASEAQVLCFDEFFVTDIGDAMILGGLMQALFERGITLIATSNIVPENLYKDGLQRQRFLPAIALLQKYTQIVNLDSGIDYRLRTLQTLPLYHTPHDETAARALLTMFQSLVPQAEAKACSIEVNHRNLQVQAVADDVAWFTFGALCDGPRSQNDYIELSRVYHTVLLEQVPVFNGENDDQARRFINLVDEFYDRGVKLILSAQAPLLELYGGSRLSFEFDRTYSRLQEMQSEEYLASAHKA